MANHSLPVACPFVAFYRPPMETSDKYTTLLSISRIDCSSSVHGLWHIALYCPHLQPLGKECAGNETELPFTSWYWLHEQPAGISFKHLFPFMSYSCNLISVVFIFLLERRWLIQRRSLLSFYLWQHRLYFIQRTTFPLCKSKLWSLILFFFREMHWIPKCDWPEGVDFFRITTTLTIVPTAVIIYFFL